jgi:hypothetical protein
VDEEQLRQEYWEETRSDPAFPLWVIFRQVGHEAGVLDNQPYLRESHREVPEVLKAVEQHPLFEAIAHDLSLAPDAARAALWYAVWQIEHLPPPDRWQSWNRRVDAAWAEQVLKNPNKGANAR